MKVFMFPRWKIRNIFLVSSNFIKSNSVTHKILFSESGCAKSSLVFYFPSQINLDKNQITMCTNKEKLLHDALRITNSKNQKSNINSS